MLVKKKQKKMLVRFQTIDALFKIKIKVILVIKLSNEIYHWTGINQDTCVNLRGTFSAVQ